MIGIEMVSDKKSRKPLDSEKVLDIWEDCKDMGVLLGKGGRYGNVSLDTHTFCIIILFDAFE